MAIINGQGRVGIRSIAAPSTPSIYTFPSGMVSSYSANGSFNDSTGGNNLTAYNGTLSNSTPKLGSGSFYFDGVNDSMATTSYGFETQSFSYSFWINVSNVGGGLLVNQYGGNGFRLKVDDYENKFFMRRFASSGFYDITTSVCFSLNTYAHVVVTRDNTSGTKIYCNNSLVGSDANLDTTNYAGARLRIGGDVDYSYISPFLGKMDAIQIFNKALNTTEISGLYNSGIGREV